MLHLTILYPFLPPSICGKTFIRLGKPKPIASKVSLHPKMETEHFLKRQISGSDEILDSVERRHFCRAGFWQEEASLSSSLSVYFLNVLSECTSL